MIHYFELCDRIRTLRASAFRAWDQCVETAGIADREDAARRDSDEAKRLWDATVIAVEGDRFPAARESLSQAAALGRAWGSDDIEQKALRLLED